MGGRELLRRTTGAVILAGSLSLLASGGTSPAAESEPLPFPSTPDATPPTHIVINHPTSTPLPLLITKPGNYSEANNPEAWKLPTELDKKTDPEKIEEATNGKLSPSDIDCSKLSNDDPYKEQCIVDFGIK